MTRREFFTSIPKGFECEVRYYCSTCEEEVLEDEMCSKTHECCKKYPVNFCEESK